MKKIVVSNENKNEESLKKKKSVLNDVLKEETPIKKETKTKKIDSTTNKRVKEITIGANDGDGNFELLEDSECFRTTKGKFTSRFAKSLDEKELVKLSKDSHDISLSFLGKKTKIRKFHKTKGRVLSSDKERSSISFENFEEGLDLNYEVHSQGVKESIIVKERQDDYTFDFTMNIGSLTPRYNEETRCIELCENDEVIYRILSPFMQDSKGDVSNDCSYEIEQDGEVLNLTLKADKEWINSNERALPVIIDPTIEIDNANIFTIEQCGDTSLHDFPENCFIVGVDANSIGSTWNLKVKVNKSLIKKSINDIDKVYLNLFVNHVTDYRRADDKIRLSYNNIKYQSIFVNKIEKNLKLDITSIIKQSSDDIIEFSIEFYRHVPIMFASPVSFYNSKYDGKEPKIVIEYLDDIDTQKATEKKYSIRRGGTSFVNLKNGAFRHVHNDTNIKSNALSIDLNHVFESRVYFCDKQEIKPTYLGTGWKTNLHQYLVKSNSFNQVSGSKDITYIDGNGVSHKLYEKWYYLGDNKEKYYIDKEAVYIDYDEKTKTCLPDGSIVEANLEIKSDDGILYSTNNITTSYSKIDNRVRHKYYMDFKYLREEVSMDESIKHYFQYFYYYGNEKIYFAPSALYLDYEGMLVGPTGKYAYLDTDSPTEIKEDEKGKYIEYKYVEWYGQPDYANHAEKKGKQYLTVEDEIIEAETDTINNDELQKLNGAIFDLKCRIKDLESSRESTKFAINRYLYQFKLINDLVKDSTNKDNTSQKVTENDNTSVWVYYNQCKSQLVNTEETIKEYIEQLDKLYSQKSLIVDREMRKTNDYILKDDKALGFDGYGRLISIQDCYDNIIQIEYGNTNEDSDKIINVIAGDKVINLNYDKITGLLDSIVDDRGRRISYKYDDSLLTAIIYNDEKKTKINYEDKISIANPMLETIEFEKNSNGKLYVCKKVYDGRISNNSILNEETELKIVSSEEYTFDESNNITKINDVIRSTQKTVNFDKLGRIVLSTDSKYEEATFYENDKLKTSAKYKINNHTLIDDIFFDGNSKTEKIKLTDFIKDSQNQLPSSNLLGLKIVFGTFHAISYDPIQVSIKASVTTIKNKQTFVEEFKQIYQEISNQTIVFPIAIDRNYSNEILIEFDSNYINSSKIYYKSVSLIKLYSGVINEYDGDRLIKTNNGFSTISYNNFDFNNRALKILKLDKNGKLVETRYNYDSSNRITYIENTDGDIKQFFYDKNGKCIETRSYNKNNSSLMRVDQTTFNEQGNIISQKGLIKKSDGTYPEKEFTYLPGTDVKTKIKKENGEAICFTYDNNTEDLLSLSSNADGINNSTDFTYNYGLLTSISHHGLKVKYQYDGLGRKTKVTFNGKDLLWNTFVDQYDKEELKISYGYKALSNDLAGLYLEKHFDKDKHLILSTFDADDSIGKTEYSYNDNDLLKSSTTSIAYRKRNSVETEGSEIKYSYIETIENTYNDFDTVVKQEKFVNGSSQVEIKNNYDIYNQLVTSSDVILRKIGKSGYRLNYLNSYDDKQRLKSVIVREGIINDDDLFTDMEKSTFEYDALGRVSHNILDTDNMSICHEYSYLQQDENSLDLIAEDILQIKINNDGIITYLTETATYTYDVSGNITSVQQDDKMTRYFYDSLNRIIREDNPFLRQTIFYKYDKAGNILQKNTYAYNITLNEIPTSAKTTNEYSYSCEGWRDQLIYFNGKEFAYDEMGRPTTYKDWEFQWNSKGELTCACDEDLNLFEYLYDSKSIRREKIANGFSTKFNVNGTQILSMTKEIINDEEEDAEPNVIETIIFRYVSGKLVGFNYNVVGSSSKEYIYLRNIQGDIIAIYNDEGKYMGGYVYDAWGNHIVLNEKGEKEEKPDPEAIININPFRYRGYFFDKETGLYYLNSRYYDPETGRFVSPDTLSIINETKGQINGLNLYMYCRNNPIMYYDPSGCLSIIWITKIFEWFKGSSESEPEKSSFVEEDININGNNPNGSIIVKIDKTSIEISNSYEITSRVDQEAILKIIMESDVYKNSGYSRSLESYLIEWRVHNKAYENGFMIESSKSVNLNRTFNLLDPRQAAEAFLYWIIGSVRTL